MVKVSDCQIPPKANRSDGVLSKWLLLRHIQSLGIISIWEPISIVVAKPFFGAGGLIPIHPLGKAAPELRYDVQTGQDQPHFHATCNHFISVPCTF